MEHNEGFITENSIVLFTVFCSLTDISCNSIALNRVRVAAILEIADLLKLEQELTQNKISLIKATTDLILALNTMPNAKIVNSTSRKLLDVVYNFKTKEV